MHSCILQAVGKCEKKLELKARKAIKKSSGVSVTGTFKAWNRPAKPLAEFCSIIDNLQICTD